MYDIYSRLKAQKALYTAIEISYSSSDPIHAPVILNLPHNGLRLRFDGIEQRLRMIEVLNFSFTPLTYQGVELVKTHDTISTLPSDDAAGESATGPTFRQVYHKLFGPTHAGEYSTPTRPQADAFGTYILSYPGLAFSFAIHHTAWKSNADFVSLLSSAAARPAHALAIFVAGSWEEAQQDHLTRACPHPRSLALGGRWRDSNPPEVEHLKIKATGTIEVARRSGPSFALVLGETTVQDLVSQLGPPDAIYRKFDRKMSIHKNRASSRSKHPPFATGSPGHLDAYSDTDVSSTHTDYSSLEEDPSTEESDTESTECFYNYFIHGIDVLMALSSKKGQSSDMTSPSKASSQASNAGQPVATKVIIHGNIPGSYEFNKYRRVRWSLESQVAEALDRQVHSESPFSEASRVLSDRLEQSNMTDEERRTFRTPMVLNRDWGDSPASSFEFTDLGSGTEPDIDGNNSGEATGTTQLYGYPHLLFEVLRNDAISCLTVY